MCIRRSPYFDNFQNKKNLKIFIFVSISFRNLVRSIHLTTCRSMFSEANTCARIAGSGENFCELPGSLLYTSEKSRAVWKKCRVCQRAMNFLLPLTKNVKNKWNWKWIQEVDADRVPFWHWCRKFDKPRVATKNYQLKKTNEKEKGTGFGGGHQILLQETSYKLIPIDRGLLQPESENPRQRIKSNDLEYS